MHARVSRIVALVLVAGAALVPVSASAGNLSFLKDSPVSYFKSQDVKLLKEAAGKVLNSTDPQAQLSWSNPKTGNSGTISALEHFTSSEGYPCKRLRVFNRAKAVQGSSDYNVCQIPGRGWLVHVDARPAQQDSSPPAN